METKEKRDGTGNYYRRKVLFWVHDFNSPVTDYILAEMSGEMAQKADSLSDKAVYEADLKLSTHKWNDATYQDIYVRSLEDVTERFLRTSPPAGEEAGFGF